LKLELGQAEPAVTSIVKKEKGATAATVVVRSI